MLNAILIPVLSLSAVAFCLSLIIVFISKKFVVHEEPLVGTVYELLPHANCGACGFPGCEAFAKALVKTRDSSLSCPPGGTQLAEQLGYALGMKMAEVKPVVSVVACQGTYENAKATAEYEGINNCWAAKQCISGTKVCPFACFGLGSCVAVCKYGAMRLENGIVVVDENKCTGCGLCIEECPQKVLVMQNKTKSRYTVACRSTDKGAATRKYCKVGCIACNKCVNVCEYDAVKVENFVAKIDPEKCTACNKCLEACPTNTIIISGGKPVVASK